MDCLNERELSSYLDERLAESERRRIEMHLSGCDRCLDLLVVAFDAGRVSAPRLRRIARTALKKKTELKWFLGAVILFALSFIFKRFFMQFLIGSAILGFKWAMEGEGARRAIMIFKGIEKKEKKFERKPWPPVSNISEDTTYGTE